VKVRYRPRAEQDLVNIADYLRAQNPRAAERVGASIRRTIGIVARFPQLGVSVDTGVRRVVESRYGYRIYFEVDSASNELTIVTIRHSRQQPP
jgi:plasmid stabilization system protein ParE